MTRMTTACTASQLQKLTTFKTSESTASIVINVTQ